jgi:hypothetical protein
LLRLGSRTSSFLLALHDLLGAAGELRKVNRDLAVSSY